MASSLIIVFLFVAAMALLPFAVKRFAGRLKGHGAGAVSSTRLISALSLSPQQRVVTVEVGPEGARTWLVLGVTGQAITCLHSQAAHAIAEGLRPELQPSAQGTGSFRG